MTEEERRERRREGAREGGATLSERLAGEPVQRSEYQSGVPAPLRRAASRFVGQSASAGNQTLVAPRRLVC